MMIEKLYRNTRNYIEQLAKQINASYENNLSKNIQQDMNMFRELGNLSAHKIWYNSTKKDIETLILRYRAMIEELLYKSKIIN